MAEPPAAAMTGLALPEQVRRPLVAAAVPLLDPAERRRAALEAYGVLDGLPDAGFDALVALAAHICQTPIAAVTLLDGDRQWFKAEQGLGVDSIEIESSFCAHGFETGADVFVVPDATADPRFATNRLVLEAPDVRSYAGAPLITPDGVPLGAVCVLDRRPRSLTTSQLEALQALALLAVELLEARRSVGRVATAAMEREEALRRAADSERSFNAVFDRASVGMLVVGLDGRIVQANAAFAAMVGRDPGEVDGQSFATLTCPDDMPHELALMTSLVSGETSNVVREKRYRRADETLVTAVSSTTVIRDASGTATAVLSHVESIEDRRRAEESLLERQSAMDAIITADSEGRVTAWNDGAERLFGHTRSQALGQPVAVIVPPEDRDAHTAGIARVTGGGTPHLVGHTVELTGLRRDGSRFPVELSLSTWSYEGRPRFTAIIRDVTERRQLQAQLVRQANTDALTAVGNRAWLMTELSLALQATPAAPLSVLVVELQGLREVDESLGMVPGDRILIDVAEHLAATLRHGDRLARVDSGDFAVLLPDTTPARAAVVAHRLRASLPPEFVVDGAPVAIGLCVGQANARGGVGAEQASDAATMLLRNATLAMAAARRAPDGVALYVSTMSEQARRRLDLHGALQEAIGRGELSLAYQPQVDLSRGCLCGVEALVRWTSPSLGEISPVEFIPIAEDTGLAVELGTWVLAQACDQAARWSRDLAAPLRVSVNVSGHQLMDAGIAATLSQVLRTTGLDPRLLILEITESVLIGDPAAVIERLRAIRALGVQIAVDDFGTGYSSLSSLTRFPVDELKVDRSFVSPLPDDSATHRVTRSIVELAHGLGLRTVGEGIETRPQLDALAALGCDVGQGYLFARPLPAEAIATWRPPLAD